MWKYTAMSVMKLKPRRINLKEESKALRTYSIVYFYNTCDMEVICFHQIAMLLLIIHYQNCSSVPDSSCFSLAAMSTTWTDVRQK